MANRAGFGRWFMAATVALRPRCFVAFSIQHSNQTLASRFGSYKFAVFHRKRLNGFVLGLSAKAF
jgi:hypothetical protein